MWDKLKSTFSYLINKIACWILFIISFTIFVIMSFDINLRHWSYGIGFCFLTILFFIMGNDGIESLAFAFKGFKMTMKNAKKTIEDADKKIEELKDLAELVVETTIESIQTRGCFSPTDADEEDLKIFNRMESLLKSFGFSPERVNACTSKWHYWIEKRYVTYLMDAARNLIPSDKRTEYDDFCKQKILPSSQELRIFLEKFEVLKDRFEILEPLIKAYEFYKNKKQHQNLELWKKREKWGNYTSVNELLGA